MSHVVSEGRTNMWYIIWRVDAICPLRVDWISELPNYYLRIYQGVFFAERFLLFRQLVYFLTY
jgi:hypothetical protein